MLEMLEKFRVPEWTTQNPGFNKTIGGSTIASICGVNPWEGKYEAWLRLTGKVPPQPENPATERGHRFEPVIADAYQATHQEIVLSHRNPATNQTWFVRDKEHFFLTGQPDRIIHDPKSSEILAGLEIKTANFRKMTEWGPEGSDSIPENYLLQTQLYAGLMGGIDWKVVVWFFRPDEEGTETPTASREYNIPFDPELFEMMRATAVEFWEKYVLPDKEPPIDSIGSVFSDYVRFKFPVNKSPMERANDEERGAIQEYLDAKRVAEDAEKKLEAMKSRLQLMIGEREGLTSDLAKVSWKNNKDSQTVDYKAIVTELGSSIPDSIKEKYTKVKKGVRIFRVSPMKS